MLMAGSTMLMVGRLRQVGQKLMWEPVPVGVAVELAVEIAVAIDWVGACGP